MPAKSKSQRRLMGAALRCKRGGPCPPYARKVAEGMSEEDLHDFASTKDKGLPNRKKAKVEKGVAKMRPCENCGRMMPITSQQCPKCGHVNALHWSQGGSFTRKALNSFKAVLPAGGLPPLGSWKPQRGSDGSIERKHQTFHGTYSIFQSKKGGQAGLSYKKAGAMTHPIQLGLHPSAEAAHAAASEHHAGVTGRMLDAFGPVRKALASATPAQKEQALKALVRLNLAIGTARAKARAGGA